MSDLKDPRVLFAAERTLLAWNRTSLALIAFGFVIERTGILMQAVAAGSPITETFGTSGPSFWLGLAFIALGAFVAAYSARQYLAVLKTLSPAEYPAGYNAKWGLAVNLVVAALGVCLAVALYVGLTP
jgi:putative membrane protein